MGEVLSLVNCSECMIARGKAPRFALSLSLGPLAPALAPQLVFQVFFPDQQNGVLHTS